jgi:hypothetical protein
MRNHPWWEPIIGLMVFSLFMLWHRREIFLILLFGGLLTLALHGCSSLKPIADAARDGAFR